MIRVVIVEDEPLARRRLLRMLRSEPDVEIAGEAADGAAAVAIVRTLAPDALFLDVQMPRMDGFAVLEALCDRREKKLRRVPAVVFTTAYDQYAVRAFEVRALDYLLKPFTRERLRAAVERIREQLAQSPAEREQRLAALLEDARRQRRLPPRLAVKAGGRTLLLDPAAIDWIQGEGNYARVWLGRTSHLARRTLASLEAELDSAHFLRVHRSAIVNLERIKEVHPWFHGDSVLVLHDGTRVTMSRTFRERVRQSLGGLF